MMRKAGSILCLVLAVALLLAACAQAPAGFPSETNPSTAAPSSPLPETDECVIRVSPEGDDAANGVDAPVQTISRALELAQEKIASGNVTVDIAQGTYPIREPLCITQAHTSREEGYVLTLRGQENTVISGGIPLTGWEKQEGSIWKVAVTDGVNVHGFYVDGVPMSVARTQVRGSFLDENGENGIVLSNRESHSDFSSYNISAQIVSCAFTMEKPETLAADALLAELAHVRMYFDQTFSHTSFAFSQVTEQDGKLTFQASDATLELLNSAKMADYDLSANRYYLVNSYLFLDEEGEYYFDRASKTLYYFSAADPNEKMCILPVAEGLLNIQGTNAKLASNIRLENLTFAYGTTTLLAEAPYKEVLSDHYVIRGEKGYANSLLPAQITVDRASNLTIRNCNFVNFDTSGIALRQHVYNVSLADSEIRNISGSGIVVGTINQKNGYGLIDRNPHPEDLSHVYSVKKNSVIPAQISICNNLVVNCGIESIGSCGILVFYGHQVDVRNNTVEGTGGSGIAVGWGFANYTVKKEAPQSAGDIRVVNNRVIHPCRKAYNAGGICTMGAFFGEGLTISGNFVDMSGAISNITPAIYLDDGSEWVTVTGNLAIGSNRWLCARALPVQEQDGVCVPGEPGGTTLMHCTICGNYSDRENQQKEFAPGILWPYATEVEGTNVEIGNNTVTEDWKNHTQTMDIYNNSGVKD